MKNWNDFSLPLHIDNGNEYLTAFNEKVDYYYEKLNKTTNNSFLKEYVFKLNKSLDYMKKQKDKINSIIKYYMRANYSKVNKIIKDIINENKKILIRPIGKAYAFKGQSVYVKDSKAIESLYLVRGRIVDDYMTLQHKEMTHIPLNLRNIIPNSRYSMSGIPALYLSCNSYVAWKELREPALEKLCISNFNMNNLLNKNIIDLTYYIENFIYYFDDMRTFIDAKSKISNIIKVIRIIPLLIACFVVDDNDDKNVFKMHYIIPQLLMQVLNDNCIGIAYRSTRIENANLVNSNLVIPIIDFKDDKNYGKIMEYIPFTSPLNIGFFNKCLFSNDSSLYRKYNNAKGIGAKQRNNIFSSDVSKYQFSFNKDILIGGDPSSQFVSNSLYNIGRYDINTLYKDTIFYSFDEFLLFYKEHKKL